MKAIFHYENSDNNSVSNVHRIIKLGKERATIHHTMKDGYAMFYWFSIFHHSFGYSDWDIRELWEYVGIKEPDGWLKMSPRKKLEKCATMVETAYENGYDIIKFAREVKERLEATGHGRPGPF